VEGLFGLRVVIARRIDHAQRFPRRGIIGTDRDALAERCDGGLGLAGGEQAESVLVKSGRVVGRKKKGQEEGTHLLMVTLPRRPRAKRDSAASLRHARGAESIKPNRSLSELRAREYSKDR